jgi:DNA-directed RNA polymerase subunit M/transcription elongation factor TFIIS
MSITNTLWHGVSPCSECGGTLHSKYEPIARAFVCAGCYNEFAEANGWEKRLSFSVANPPRVHHLAKAMNMSSKHLLSYLHNWYDYSGRSASSRVPLSLALSVLNPPDQA